MEKFSFEDMCIYGKDDKYIFKYEKVYRKDDDITIYYFNLVVLFSNITIEQLQSTTEMEVHFGFRDVVFYIA